MSAISRRGRRGGFNTRLLGEFEEKIKERLEIFLHSQDQELILEPMDNKQRKTVHILARKLDLRSISKGVEPERYMIITRATLKSHLFSCASLTETQSVNITTDQKKSIRKLIDDFSISIKDVEFHLELADYKGRCKSNNSIIHDRALVPPPSSMSREMENFRRRLPTFEKRGQLLSAINRNQVTLITGGTGCGKTTQVPQFLLEEASQYNIPIRIICTQPRRLPAIAVSERVAKERGEKLGTTVGYHIRLEQKTSESTILTYCTSGVLLRMLTADALAHNVSHIILDEIHEREQNTDYLLIALKQALKARDDLKVILMSATMEGNKEMFLNYFNNNKIGHIEIPSRLYDVDKFYLPDILAMTGYMPSSIFGGLFQTPSLFEKPSNKFPRVSEFRVDEVKEITSVRTAPDLASMGQYGQWTSTQTVTPDYDTLAQHSMHPSSSTSALGNCYEGPSGQYNGYAAPNGYTVEDHQSMNLYHPEAYEWNNSYTSPSNTGYVNYYAVGGHTNTWNPAGLPVSDQGELHQQAFNVTQPAMSVSAHSQNSMFYLPNDGSEPVSSSQYGFGHQRQFDAAQHLNELLPNRPSSFDPSYMPKLLSARVQRKLLVDTYLDLGGQQWSESVDTDLATAVVKYCMDSAIIGSILVFLPGYEDILSIREKIKEIERECKTRPIVYTLHSQMNSADQQRVFDPTPKGARKVILSTNIAEASLTIDDVVFVVDCGKVKEKSYDHESRISQLKVQWIAKSNAEQRSGRAGRCRNGFCFRLYTKQDYEEMYVTQVAEMRRSAIHEVCLHAKMFAPDNVTVRDFLEMAPEPPSKAMVDNSLEFLEQLGALYTRVTPSIFEPDAQNPSKIFNQYHIDTEIEPDITELGRLIAHLPLEPQLARLLLFGLALKCLHPIITLVSALSHRDPFILPMSEEARRLASDARDEFGRRDFSDHLMLMRAFYEYCKVSNNNNRAFHFCQEKFLSFTTMKMIHGIRGQLWGELKRLHLVPSHVYYFDDFDLNQYSDSWPMVQAAILAGCYPGIGFVRVGSKMRKIRTRAVDTASLHPSSVIKRQVLAANKRSEKMNRLSNDVEPEIEYLAYQELAKIDEGLTLRMVTACTPLTVLLFAGPIRTPKHLIRDFEITEEDFLSSDGSPNEVIDEEHEFYMQKDYILELEPWLAIKGKFEDLQLVMKLRFKLMSWFLEFLKNPTGEISRQHNELLECLNNVLRMDHRRFGFPTVLDLPKYTDLNRNRLRSSHHEQRSYQLTNSYPTYDKANSKHGDQAEKFKPTKKNEEEEASSSKATPNGYSNGELKNEEQSKEMPATRCAGVEMLFASCKVGPTNHHRTTTTSDDTWNTNEEEMPPALNFSKDSVQKNGVRLPNNHVKPARFIRQDSNSRRSPDRSHQRQWDSRQRPADKFSNWRSNDARIDQRSSNFNEERNTKNTKVFYGSNYKGNSSSEFSNGLRKQRENQESSGKNRPYEDQQGSSRTYDRYERNDRLERDDRYERNVRPPRSSRGGFVSSRPRGNYRAASNSTYHSDKNDHNYQ